MYKKPRVIACMLAIIAVSLTVNIVVMGSRNAEAQESQTGDGEPYVVKRVPNQGFRYWRVWSDGQIDEMRVTSECDIRFTLVVVGPAGHPFEVVDAESALNTIIVEYADGRVDFISQTNPSNAMRCTIAGKGSDPFCFADTDRDGTIGVRDLLNVLAQWGPCVDPP